LSALLRDCGCVCIAVRFRIDSVASNAVAIKVRSPSLAARGEKRQPPVTGSLVDRRGLTRDCGCRTQGVTLLGIPFVFVIRDCGLEADRGLAALPGACPATEDCG
jgi:hypothetical protein